MNKRNKGITLIALVVTIVVLLILAGITIASVTGEKGIIKEARTAKELSEKAALEELVDLAIIKAEQKHRNPTIDNVIEELKNNKVISDESKVNKETGSIITVLGYEITGKLDDYIGKVSVGDNNTPGDGNTSQGGNSTGGGDTQEPIEKSELEKAKEAGTVLDENNPTTITDSYGNEIRVPEGFKIASDSANDVTGGVVIEDVSHGATVGSQFVWIPTGTVYTNRDRTTSKTINLNRYTFSSDGSPSEQGENIIKSYYQELATSNKGNTVAKNINSFKTSANTNKGYYIGRYEAKSTTQRNATTDSLGQITVKDNGYSYCYITQLKAATVARGMYGTNKKFTSDLVNSYAWDTAIVFLQLFDDREDKSIPYSKQSTNNLSGETKQDKICNIWDMATNCWEVSTETSLESDKASVLRGGNSFLTNYESSLRYNAGVDYDGVMAAIISFRVVLYL